MKMNNNPIYCESITNYGAYERKQGILSLFKWVNASHGWIDFNSLEKRTFQQSEYRK